MAFSMKFVKYLYFYVNIQNTISILKTYRQSDRQDKSMYWRENDGNNLNGRTIIGGQVLRHHTQYLHAHTHNLPFRGVIIPLSS